MSNVTEINPMKDWFFTFGFEQLLPGQVVVMRNMTIKESRDLMFHLVGNHWAFQYPIEELEKQQKDFGYTIARELTRDNLPTDLKEVDNA